MWDIGTSVALVFVLLIVCGCDSVCDRAYVGVWWYAAM
jgi:hypothetical protein